jgi:hypothetical protein
MLDPLTYELCFPGGLTGETEILCPQCDTLLTVSVDDPNGSKGYRCDECGAGFVVNWSDGQARR